MRRIYKWCKFICKVFRLITRIAKRTGSGGDSRLTGVLDRFLGGEGGGFGANERKQ